MANKIYLFLYILVPYIFLINGFDITNRDPSLADPQAAVECIGNIPDWAYFVVIVPPPSGKENTLQNLCAHEQYGGTPALHNLGAYCAESQNTYFGDENDLKKPWVVTFSSYQLDRMVDLSYQTPGRIAMLRLSSYCARRCHCSGVEFARRGPAYFTHGVPNSVINLSTPRFMPGGKEMAIGTYAESAFRIRQRVQVLNFIQDDSYRYSSRPMGFNVLVGLTEKNMVECFGPWPDFDLPSPATPEMFGWISRPQPWTVSTESSATDSLTKLCAVTLSGGHERYNAGAYCHISRIFDKRGGVWFSDEMTPDLRWTLNAPKNTELDTRQSSFRLRKHCAAYCVCSDKEVQTRPATDADFDWLGDDVTQVGELWPGLLDVSPGQVLERMGRPVPTPSTMQASEPSPAAEETCSRICTSQTDCTSSELRGECGSTQMCVAVTRGRLDITRAREGNGGRIQRARLMPFMLARCASAAGRIWRLGGRGLENGGPYCACNASYVSAGCCASEDGVLWEPHNAKIGWLEL